MHLTSTLKGIKQSRMYICYLEILTKPPQLMFRTVQRRLFRHIIRELSQITLQTPATKTTYSALQTKQPSKLTGISKNLWEALTTRILNLTLKMDLLTLWVFLQQMWAMRTTHWSSRILLWTQCQGLFWRMLLAHQDKVHRAKQSSTTRRSCFTITKEMAKKSMVI